MVEPARKRLEHAINATYLLLYAFVLSLIFAISYWRSKSLLAPAPLWNLCWMLLFFVGAILGREYLYDAASTLYLFLLAISFNIVPLFSSRSRDELRRPRPFQVREVITSPLWLLLSTALVGILGALHLSSELGNSLLSANSFSTLLNAVSANASSLYRGEVVRSAIDTVAYAVMQFGFAALGGRLRTRPDRWTWFVLVVNLVAAASWTAVTTQRSYFLVQILWLTGGYIAAAVGTGNERISARAVRWASLAAGALAVFVVAVRAVRVGGARAQFGLGALSQGQLWAAGYIPAFSQWHHNGGGTVVYPLRLLSGTLSLVGSSLDDGSLADGGEFTYVGSGQSSNAATMMRAVVLTGGSVGAFLIVILLGAAIQAFYSRARQGRPGAVAGYAGAVTVILWSVNAWQFNNGNRVLAQLLVSAAVAISASRAASSRSQRDHPRRTGSRDSSRPRRGTAVRVITSV